MKMIERIKELDWLYLEQERSFDAWVQSPLGSHEERPSWRRLCRARTAYQALMAVPASTCEDWPKEG